MYPVGPPQALAPIGLNLQSSEISHLTSDKPFISVINDSSLSLSASIELPSFFLQADATVIINTTAKKI
ncbi:hypothetical protein D3C87_1480070 [compost metagenome]